MDRKASTFMAEHAFTTEGFTGEGLLVFCCGFETKNELMFYDE